MLNWFRRQRLIAALMILANPALVGSWVAAYHPCPVSDGALGRSGVQAAVSVVAMDPSGHEGMAMAEEAAPAEHPPVHHDHSQNNGPCSCIGQCLTSGLALPSVAGRESRVVVVVTEVAVRISQYALVQPASDPLEHLPPSTAPPIA